MARRIKIRGENWRMSIERPPAKDTPKRRTVALCHYATRTIYIHPKERNKLRCVLHEILHACLPDIEEKAIEETELALYRGIRLIQGPLK